VKISKVPHFQFSFSIWIFFLVRSSSSALISPASLLPALSALIAFLAGDCAIQYFADEILLALQVPQGCQLIVL
jgi:hypothetical protein